MVYIIREILYIDIHTGNYNINQSGISYKSYMQIIE